MEQKRLFVSHKDESVRMFKSDFLDLFSRVSYWVPMAIFIPVVTIFFCLSIFYYEVSFLSTLGYFGLGLFFWTIFEYVMHRFIFHYHPTSKIGQRIHFVTHGVHHDYPNDSKRLVMPPGVSLPIGLFFYAVYYFAFGEAICASLFSGFCFGYVVYDTLHFASHYSNWQNPIFQSIKKHHMRHHYQDPDKGFGFTSKFWDHIFGSNFKD